MLHSRMCAHMRHGWSMRTTQIIHIYSYVLLGSSIRAAWLLHTRAMLCARCALMSDRTMDTGVPLGVWNQARTRRQPGRYSAECPYFPEHYVLPHYSSTCIGAPVFELVKYIALASGRRPPQRHVDSCSVIAHRSHAPSAKESQQLCTCVYCMCIYTWIDICTSTSISTYTCVSMCIRICTYIWRTCIYLVVVCVRRRNKLWEPMHYSKRIRTRAYAQAHTLKCTFTPLPQALQGASPSLEKTISPQNSCW